MTEHWNEDDNHFFASSSIVFISLCRLFDYLFFIFETLCSVLMIMVSFAAQVILSLLNIITFGFGKVLVNVVYWSFWLLFHFSCGILGLEDRSTSAFSWLLVVLAFLVYCDRQYHHWYLKFSNPLLLYIRRLTRRRLFHHQNRQLYAQAVLENQRNEHMEIEPINRQLEAENRENENEENSIVEADRHRIDLENRINIQRENGADLDRVRLENRQNVERERQNTRTALENRRNQTQEQHRYFLRERNRGVYSGRGSNHLQHVGPSIARSEDSGRAPSPNVSNDRNSQSSSVRVSARGASGFNLQNVSHGAHGTRVATDTNNNHFPNLRPGLRSRYGDIRLADT